jgi:hypothetical protein
MFSTRIAHTLYSSAIVASGSAALLLTCTTKRGILDTQDDIITTCTGSSSYSVNSILLKKEPLPAYSLETASPSHGGCTFDSVVDPTFWYSGMSYQTFPSSAILQSFRTGLSGPWTRDGAMVHYFYRYDGDLGRRQILSGEGKHSV